MIFLGVPMILFGVKKIQFGVRLILFVVPKNSYPKINKNKTLVPCISYLYNGPGYVWQAFTISCLIYSKINKRREIKNKLKGYILTENVNFFFYKISMDRPHWREK